VARGVHVRFIVGISLLVLGVGMLSCRMEGVGAHGAEKPHTSTWVRTVDGWERSDRWAVTPVWEPGVHPLVVAVGQALMSVMALVALGGNPNLRGRLRPCGHTAHGLAVCRVAAERETQS
jgi:hypothetical protein